MAYIDFEIAKQMMHGAFSVWKARANYSPPNIAALSNGLLGNFDVLDDRDHPGKTVAIVEQALEESALYADAILENVVRDMQVKSAEGMVKTQKQGRKLAKKYLVITPESIGTSFNKSVAGVQAAHPDLFTKFRGVFDKYDQISPLFYDNDSRGNTPPMKDFLLCLVLLHRMCSSPKWERAFMIRGVAESYLDLGDLLTSNNPADVRALTLGGCAATYGIPLPNRRLLMLPAYLLVSPYFKRDPIHLGQEFIDNVASMYLSLYKGIASYDGMQSQQRAKIKRIKNSLDSLLRGSPDRLAKMLTSPAFLTMPSSSPNDIYSSPFPPKYVFGHASGSTPLPIVHKLYEILNLSIEHFLSKWDPSSLSPHLKAPESEEEHKKRRQALGVTKGEKMMNLRYLLDSDDFHGLESYPPNVDPDGNRINFMHHLVSICRQAWKERDRYDWLGQEVMISSYGKVPLFKLLFNRSPQIPLLLSRDEWDKYMTSDKGNFLIVGKTFSMESEGRPLMIHRLREEDFFLRNEITQSTFLDHNIHEVATTIRIETFMSMQSKRDTFFLARMLSAGHGYLGERLGNINDPDVMSIWRQTGQTPLEIILARLREDPPLIEDAQHGRENDISWCNFGRGLSQGWFGLGRKDTNVGNVRISNDTFDLMTSPIGYVNLGDSGERLYFSLFDIVLGRATRCSLNKNFDNLQVLKELISADRFWDIPIDPNIHLGSPVQTSINEKRLIEGPYKVFDRLIEMLLAMAMKGRTILRIPDRAALIQQLKGMGDELFVQLASKGQEYLETAASKFFATKSRQEAIDMVFPAFRSRLKVHTGLDMASPYGQEFDVFDEVPRL